MKKILVITTEPLPLPGGYTTGAGLRAWGIAQGLMDHGFDVTIATPLEGEQAHSQQESSPSNVRFFDRPQLPNLITEIAPDVVVLQHWGLAYALPAQLSCPLVIDLAGPHLLERYYWGNKDEQRDLEEKLAALRRADFITCGGEYQKHYFYPYLRMAGWDLAKEPVPVIPFSVPPDPRTEPLPSGEITFIYGGAFLAWQNPEKAITWLLEEMDAAGAGRLLFYGGAHPGMDASAGRFVNLHQALKNHPRVEMRGWKPFHELLSLYATEGHVALDLMERNPERELAYTTRTMIYLYCGLPVIYNDYSEISQLVERYDCGWTLNPDQETGFRLLIQKLLRGQFDLNALRNNARHAAMNQTWDKTIQPLVQYCTAPHYRQKELPASNSPPNVTAPLSTSQPSATRHGRPILRNPGKFLGIMVYFPVRILCRFLNFSCNNKRSTRAQKL